MTPDFSPILPAIRDHAAACAPRECCGLAVVRKGKLRYVPCRNLLAEVLLKPGEARSFAIDPADYAVAEDLGAIVAIVHSHVNEPPQPSMADKVGIEASGLPWLIVNHPVGHWTVTAPSGFVAPLTGRPFVHGVLDCYSLIRDWYLRERGVALPDYERADRWWEKGGDLYRQNFAGAGFVEIGERELQPGDVILMQAMSPVTNHGAIYLGGNLILQHVMGRLSSRDVWGGAWRKSATHFLRYLGVPG